MNWRVENGTLQLIWTGADDLKEFVEKTVQPSAARFGLKISFEQTQPAKLDVVKPQ